MGVCSFCCKSTAVLVALLAIFLGALFSGALKSTGIFAYVDKFAGSRGAPYFMGMFPAMHEGTPWGFTLEQMPDLSGETFLVTGGNVGLGYWTAYHLASRNGRVVIACRSQVKCDQAAARIQAETGKTVETLLMDLSSFASIRGAAQTFSGKHGSLDSLVLNAGIMVPPFSLTADGLESQIGTNHFGHFLLTRLLMPLLEVAAEQKGVATIVPVSSAAHYDSYPEGIRPTIASMNDEKTYSRQLAYGQSKLANVLFGQELSERVKAKGILVNSIHPGGVDTDLLRHVIDVIARFSSSAATLVQSQVGSLTWHPRDASLTQLFAAVGPKLRQGKITGKYYHPIAREARPDLHTFNATLQKHLWSMSEQFIETH
eukprot:TRINITY_DN18877_c0_g1_i3.p1 TRINITY_DN18877_c0_g1~~TRINITY_DN18877_c0_g1_i3.p1  ORF type:complete len:396 (+),score=40.15 TRINITY_DN18877_c0_g1_i3:73-1188(+)